MRRVSYLLTLPLVLASCATTGSSGPAAELEANKEVVRRYYEAVSHPANLGALDQLVSEDFLNYARPGEPQRGREHMVRVQERILAAFPDRDEQIVNMVAEGETVAVYNILEGTHLGALLGKEPTGKRVRWRRLRLFTIRNGQIVEHHAVRADVELLYQLDIIEVPEFVAKRLGLQPAPAP